MRAIRPFSFDLAPQAELPAGVRSLNSAPIGAEVVFTNPEAPEASGFRNENAIKLESDLFIAHEIREKNPLATRQQIEDKLTTVAARYNPSLKDVKQIVSVTWIVQYAIP